MPSDAMNPDSPAEEAGASPAGPEGPAVAGSPATADPGPDAETTGRLARAERRLVELERVYHAAIREREIASSLIGKPLVGGAAGQLIRLWSEDFDVIEDGTRVRVAAADGRSVEQTIADRLASPEFAHFCLPSTRGGTSARGESRSTQSAPAPPRPRTLGEAAVQQWRTGAAVPGSSPGTGWGRSR